MFDYALRHCNHAAAQGPFFTTIMTCSDHTPYAIPQGTSFQPRSRDMNKQVVEYADWSLGRFMRMARLQPWYANTLFVLIADHGGVWGTNRYDMPLSYHHIPMLFHYPARLQPQQIDRIAMQVDLGPTLLGILPVEWSNTTFGLNLLTQPRRYAYFCNDDKIGVIDSNYYYIYRIAEGIESLHSLSDTSAANLLSTHQAGHRNRADSMKRYGLGLTQASQSESL
jgi:phosphoglycerol transferase MdoB-like AlkP superfamily enzyme